MISTANRRIWGIFCLVRRCKQCSSFQFSVAALYIDDLHLCCFISYCVMRGGCESSSYYWFQQVSRVPRDEVRGFMQVWARLLINYTGDGPQVWLAPRARVLPASITSPSHYLPVKWGRKCKATYAAICILHFLTRGRQVCALFSWPCCCVLVAAAMDEIKKTFERYDKDKNGYISYTVGAPRLVLCTALDASSDRSWLVSVGPTCTTARGRCQQGTRGNVNATRIKVSV